jgi:hypothetical protein
MTVSRRSFLACLGAAGAMGVLGGLPETSLAAPGPGRRFPGDPGRGRLYYGATVSYDKSLTEWESRLGRRLSSHRHFHSPDEIGELARDCADDLRLGRMPHASIKLPATWQDVASGARDSWLHRLLDRVAEAGGPVLLTLHHEPEDDVAGREMQPRDWVAMQERAIAKAERRAPNVTIVPVLMDWTFDPSSGRRPGQWMVPSARVQGVDIYNPWSPTNGKPWVSFATDGAKVVPWADGRPIVVAEYGCRADPRNPERAARWMREAFDWARRHDVVSMSYFHSWQNTEGGSYELSGRRMRVFRRLLGHDAVARP